MALTACNAETPTALADINAAAIHGRFLFSFSEATCTLEEVEASFTQFTSGGALPETIRLIGSWQFVGSPQTGDLEGELIRDTGEVLLEFIPEVRWMAGIFLDNDNAALAYHDVDADCRARVSARKIQ